MSLSKTFCILPFVGMNVHVYGGLGVCCQQSHNNVTHHFDEFKDWRTNGIKNLKRDLVNGVKNEQCKTCWNSEINGVKSYRQIWNEHFKHHGIFEKLYNGDDVVESEFDLNFLHLDFDNYCNLKCIMCNPRTSSSIETEYKQNKEKYITFIGEQVLPAKKWHDTPVFDQLLHYVKNTVDTLILTGGEPMINPTVKRLLESLGNPEKINLIITTNATVVKPDWLDIIAKFKKVDFVVSLEGVEEHNDYIRYGSTWSDIEKNIKLLNQLDNLMWGQIGFNHVLQHTSVYSLPRLLDFCLENNYTLNFGHLSHPPYLSLQGATEDQKQGLIDQINARIKKYFFPGNPTSTDINRLIFAVATVKNAVYDPEIEKKFYEYVYMLDSIRGTDFNKTFRN